MIAFQSSFPSRDIQIFVFLFYKVLHCKGLVQFKNLRSFKPWVSQWLPSILNFKQVSRTKRPKNEQYIFYRKILYADGLNNKLWLFANNRRYVSMFFHIKLKNLDPFCFNFSNDYLGQSIQEWTK